jgi:hypothetical protein
VEAFEIVVGRALVLYGGLEFRSHQMNDRVASAPLVLESSRFVMILVPKPPQHIALLSLSATLPFHSITS